jgi:Nucleotidyl transferase AbiEii toxin, Type IV TA system
MRALEFWKTITMDQTNFLERLIAVLDQHGIRYCVVGGQAVNAYVEPLVSLDLDLVVAAKQLREVETLLSKEFNLKRFPYSLNVSSTGSDLRVQIQTDPRYSEFVQRAQPGAILGMAFPVANLEDVLRGKIWALQDPERRGSKRQKDLADVARLIEAYPRLKELVPEDILEKLL